MYLLIICLQSEGKHLKISLTYLAVILLNRLYFFKYFFYPLFILFTQHLMCFHGGWHSVCLSQRLNILAEVARVHSFQFLDISSFDSSQEEAWCFCLDKSLKWWNRPFKIFSELWLITGGLKADPVNSWLSLPHTHSLDKRKFPAFVDVFHRCYAFSTHRFFGQ